MTEGTFTTAARSRTTLAQIAHDASVSMSTVSKVLNARTGVSNETRVRVEALLAAHGYNRPGAENPHGALIELVFEHIDSPWSLELIRGVERVARQNGMTRADDCREPAARLVVDRGVPGAKQPRHAHARLMQLDQDLAVPIGVDALDVAPEERVDRGFDGIGVEPERVGDGCGIAGVA